MPIHEWHARRVQKQHGPSPGASLINSTVSVTLPSLHFHRAIDSSGSSKDRVGQHSIRINEQYRVCFRWENGYADQVEITDYH